MARNNHPEVTVNRILDVATKLFLEKGYEQTTIQAIIDALGDLSKGAIYHHFKSKEEIIVAVIDRLFDSTNVIYSQILLSTDMTGLAKLKKLFSCSVSNSKQESVLKVMPNLLKNPKFLALQLDSTINDIAPNFIEPIILEGIKDGSIQTEYPKELAEVMCLLSNIWINPLIFNCSSQEFYKKIMVFKQILIGLGVDFIDDKLIETIEQLRKTIPSEN